MNKWIFISIIFFSFFTELSAQYADCIPDPEVNDTEGDGIRVPVDLPVAFNGDEYSCVLTIIPPSKADTWGVFDIKITKMQIEQLTNLPVGLHWESNSNNADDYLYASEKYCIVVDGIANSTPGIFSMDVMANVWIKTLFEYQAPGNPQNGGSITITVCNELNLDLGDNRTITTEEEIALSANQHTSYHTYLWNDNSTCPVLHVNGADLGVGTYQYSVAVYDTVGTTGIYEGRETLCVKTDDITITVIEDAAVDSEIVEQFTISPNPSNGKFIVTNHNFTKDEFIEIRDINGVVIYSTILSNEISEIDLSNIQKGMYFFYPKSNQSRYKPIKIVLL